MPSATRSGLSSRVSLPPAWSTRCSWSTTTRKPGTEEEVRKTSARMVKEPRQGYGHASRRGLLEATGELIVLAEPDGTFVPEDIRKLLVYSTECDAVFGTRTTWELVWEGANMDWFLRWGNWAVAKLMEVLFNTSHLSDVGCTYRLLRTRHREARREQHDGRRQPRWRGDHVAHDRLGRAVRRGAGQLSPARRASSVTGSRLTAVSVGLRMIGLVFRAAASLPAASQAASGVRPGTARTPNDEAAREQLTTLTRSRPSTTSRCPRTSSSTTCANGPRSCRALSRAGPALDVGCGTGALAERLAGARLRGDRRRSLSWDARGPRGQ